MTTTRPTITDLGALATAAEAAANAKAALNAAKAAYEQAENLAIDALLTAGLPSVELNDGTKVTLKGGLEGETTRTVDVTILHDALSGAVFAQVTKETVDLKAFDAAVTAGLVPAQVAADATTVKPKKATLLITAAVKA